MKRSGDDKGAWIVSDGGWALTWRHLGGFDGFALDWHAPEPIIWEGQEPESAACEYIGTACYVDQAFSLAGEVEQVRLLVGDEAAWICLEGLLDGYRTRGRRFLDEAFDLGCFSHLR